MHLDFISRRNVASLARSSAVKDVDLSCVDEIPGESVGCCGCSWQVELGSPSLGHMTAERGMSMNDELSDNF